MPAPLDTEVAIETPEHIVFHYRVAGPARRAGAYVLDLLLCYVVFGVLALVIGALAGAGASSASEAMRSGGAGVGLIFVLLFFVQWIYFVLWEALRGTTPGKTAAGLRVMTTAGRPIGFYAAALRNLLRAADALPFGYAVGVISMALTKRFQRFGDLVAGTMVVIPERSAASRAVILDPPASPSELATIPDDVSLDAEERAAIELFLRRKGTLGVAREAELAKMITGDLAERFDVRVTDPVRFLALIYDRAANAGRSEAPPSSRASVPPPFAVSR